MKSTPLVLAFMLLAGCSEPPPPPQCEQFVKAIDLELRVAAYEISRGAGDNSAVRETVREIRIANHLATIGIQVQLMAQNKCPPIKVPIDVDAYEPQAKACFKALAAWKSGDPYPVPGCDVKKWSAPAVPG